LADIAEIRKALMYFNVENYLRGRSIPYSTDGKNISPGYLGVKCPFCPPYDPDPSLHCGIHKTKNNMSCWRCGTKGTVLKYIMKMEKVSINPALEIIKGFGNLSVTPQGSGAKTPLQNTLKITIPKEFTTEILPGHRNYLEGRGFDADFLYDKYKLQSCGPVGKYKLRIIVPFFLNDKIVTFTARDITDLAEEKYKHLEIEESIIPPKQIVYNIDSADDTLIIVEGVTDTWRMGDGTGAIQGLTITPQQLYMIVQRQFKRIFVLLDAGTRDLGLKLAYSISPFVYDVNMWELPEGDPGKLKEDDVKSIRREIFGRIY